MDLELFKTLTKYPFIFEGEFYDSEELKQNKSCTGKCKVRECLQLLQNIINQTEYVCPKGYNNSLFIISDLKFIINGLIYKTNRKVPLGRKEVRKDWIVDQDSLLIFKDKIREIENHIINRANEGIEKNFSMFHDFKTSMTIFFTCTHDIISKLQGDTFIEKLEGSDKAYRDLYNALELITSQLRMIDVIINPKSIVFGNMKPINIYQLFEKIKILFGHLSIKKRDINIKLIKEAWVGDCNCYESIEFVPLILLDNALKYSVPDSDIEIKFEQHQDNLKVLVKSIGPFVSDENKDKIFEKFFRDKSAEAFSKEGMGMGLWIAQQILRAHNSKIHYYKDPRETRPIGLNVFEFELQTI
jgi:K+-sensing histidine kinase KdpD